MSGKDYVAVVRLSSKSNGTFAMPGETCERVPPQSLPALLARGRILPAGDPWLVYASGGSRTAPERPQVAPEPEKPQFEALVSPGEAPGVEAPEEPADGPDALPVPQVEPKAEEVDPQTDDEITDKEE